MTAMDLVPTGVAALLAAVARFVEPADADPSGDGSLSTRAHVLIVVTTLLSIGFIIRLVRRQKLRSKYSLLWIVVAIALATVAVFPGLLDRVSRAAGIYYPPATFLFLSVGFLFLVVVHFSWEFSRSEERIRTLAEDMALLQAAHDAAIAALREGALPPERLPGPQPVEPAASDEMSGMSPEESPGESPDEAPDNTSPDSGT